MFNSLYKSILLFFITITVAQYADSTPIAGFKRDEVASNLTLPTSMAFAPDGRLFITEQVGRIRIIKNGQLLPTPFATIPAFTRDERGLLGLAVDPNFAQNRRIFIYYTANSNPPRNTVSMLTASSNNPDVAESGENILLQVGSTEGYHNGGALHFGQDGMLYIAVGDLHTATTAQPHSQNIRNLFGKILRVDVRSGQLQVPADNPFVGVSGARGEVWALGFRNPFTFAPDPSSSTIYINDVGQGSGNKRSVEEINPLVKGGNYGWPTCEGSCNNNGFINPVHQYNGGDDGGCAITGGTFYRGRNFPSSFSGSYFYADYCGGWIKRRDANGAISTFDNGSGISRIIDLDVNPITGALYAIQFEGGKIHKFESTAPQPNGSPRAVFSISPESGNAPLNVQFDASASTDPEGSPLTYRWDFGDNTSGTGVKVSHNYARSGNFRVTLTVTDNNQNSDEETQTVRVLGSGGNAPRPAIIANDTFIAGSKINFSVSAQDTEDGELSANSLAWKVDLLHHPETDSTHHRHPVIPETTGKLSDSFDVSTTNHSDDIDIWFRITLKATDSSGKTTEITRDIKPRLVTFNINSEPAGLEINVNGRAIKTPVNGQAIIGVQKQLSINSRQNLNGKNYTFSKWSNNQPATQSYIVSNTDTTLTAIFTDDSGVPNPNPNKNLCSDLDGDKITDVVMLKGNTLSQMFSRQNYNVVAGKLSPTNPVMGEFPWGIGVADLSSTTSGWRLSGDGSQTISVATQWGLAGCDFDGDKIADLAGFNPPTKEFIFKSSKTGVEQKSSLSIPNSVTVKLVTCGNVLGTDIAEIVLLETTPVLATTTRLNKRATESRNLTVYTVNGVRNSELRVSSSRKIDRIMVVDYPSTPRPVYLEVRKSYIKIRSPRGRIGSNRISNGQNRTRAVRTSDVLFGEFSNSKTGILTLGLSGKWGMIPISTRRTASRQQATTIIPKDGGSLSSLVQCVRAIKR
jgi:glucose/arabinose dehydrogenase